MIYGIVNTLPFCPVRIRPLTGELTLLTNLDFEAIKKYTLMIEAQDLGVPSRSSNITVIINVLDVNDNEPKFMEQNYSVAVSLNIKHLIIIYNNKK